jgi:hypothetical protein
VLPSCFFHIREDIKEKQEAAVAFVEKLLLRIAEAIEHFAEYLKEH